LRKKRILVIDDDEVILRVFRETLELEGHGVDPPRPERRRWRPVLDSAEFATPASVSPHPS
jgi:CheY-like chemotaxis protein